MTSPIRGPVLAATDLTDRGADAVRQAHAVAADIGARLTVCHVLPELSRVRMLFPEHAGADQMLRNELEHRARVATNLQIADTIGQLPPDGDVVVEVGSPHASILDLAERSGAGLIVVGAGPVALRVARYSPCPVLIARPSPAGGAVLGATDFSDPSLPAVEAAVAEAERRAAPLRLIHCIEVLSPAMIAMPAMTPLPPLPQDVIREAEASALERLTDSLRQFGASGKCVVAHGRADAGIIEAARESATSVVVVGTRGRTGLPRLALGSVAESVVGGAPCSVLVVHLTTSRQRDRVA